MNNSVITVIGKDRVGIVYDVSKFWRKTKSIFSTSANS